MLSGNTEGLHLQLSPTQDIDFESSSHNLGTQDLKIRLDFTESESVADRNAIHMNSEPSSTLNLQMSISQNTERDHFFSDSRRTVQSKRKNSTNFTHSYQAATTQDLDLYLGLSDEDELPNLPDFMTTSTPAPGKVPDRQTSHNTREDDDIECLTPLRSRIQKRSATFSMESDVVVVQETEKDRDSRASEVILVGNDSHFSGTNTGKNRKRKSDVFVDMTDESENTQGDGPAPKKKKRKSKDGKTEKCPSCQSELFCSVVH